MKKILLSVIALMLAFWVLPTYSSAKVEDGIYSLNYQVNKAGTISASISNDYFVKPAKLFVENGKMRVQLTIKQSAWVTKFEGPHGGNDVISENKEANTRLVEFNVTDIQNLTVVKMNVDIPEMSYHHTYSTDFVWDPSSLKLLEAAKKPEPKPEPKAAEPVKEEVKEEAKKEEPKAVVESKPAAAPAPVAAKVEEKPAAVVKTESKPAEEQKPAEAKPVEEKKEEPVEKAVEAKAVEETVTEEKAAEATKEEKPAVEGEEEKVAVANAEEATEEKEATASLTEEAETANAPAEAKSSSSAWIYIVIALILAGAAVLFMRKRSSANKA